MCFVVFSDNFQMFAQVLRNRVTGAASTETFDLSHVLLLPVHPSISRQPKQLLIYLFI